MERWLVEVETTCVDQTREKASNDSGQTTATLSEQVKRITELERILKLLPIPPGCHV
jgi:hypothetical protein